MLEQAAGGGGEANDCACGSTGPWSRRCCCLPRAGGAKPSCATATASTAELNNICHREKYIGGCYAEASVIKLYAQPAKKELLLAAGGVRGAPQAYESDVSRQAVGRAPQCSVVMFETRIAARACATRAAINHSQVGGSGLEWIACNAHALDSGDVDTSDLTSEQRQPDIVFLSKRWRSTPLPSTC